MMVRVRLRGWLMYYAYKSPYKDKSTRMCVLVYFQRQYGLVSVMKSVCMCVCVCACVFVCSIYRSFSSVSLVTASD